MRDTDDCLYIAFSGVDVIPPRIYKDYEKFMKYCKEHKPFIGYEYVFNGVQYVKGKQIFYYADIIDEELDNIRDVLRGEDND